jgi:hypothetical protein
LLAIALSGISEARADQAFTLGSGKSVDIVSMGPLHFGADDTTALMLTYRATVPLSDMPSLSRERDEIWDRFVHDVEGGHYESAAIVAKGPEEGFIVKLSHNYNFTFQKKNGNWRALDFKPAEKASLTEDMIRDIIARFDAALETRELSAAALYLADDWTGTATTSLSGSLETKTAGRAEFLSSMAQVLTAMKDYKHTRTIRKITISSDGASATIDSDERESGTLNGKSLKTLERSTDVIAIEGNSAVFTKSTSTEVKSL